MSWHKISTPVVKFNLLELHMKKLSTNRLQLNAAQIEELLLDEIRKQNWIRISVSKILREEILLSIQ